jgi:methylenetetrahydrofolate dehydrogenase (NADP+) / methenyltetrahydrofolate cyclohydrolase
MILDGKKIQLEMREELKERFHSMRQLGVGIVYVGTDPVIENYIRIKRKFAEAVGVHFEIYHLTDQLPEKLLHEEVRKICEHHDAVVIQLPLPKEYDQKSLVNIVPKEKDIDMLGSEAIKDFEQGISPILPPVVGAVEEILRSFEISLIDKKIAVLGSGRLVGRPVREWLINNGTLPDVFDISNPIGQRGLVDYDIIISGMGTPHMITPDMISEGVVLLDAGASDSDGTVAGDADPRCAEKCFLFSPVPGGIGPITVAMLFKNLLLLNE